MVKECLDHFCECSGLKVNDSKTRVFFSKNINHIRSAEISDALGFTLTADLGKYLGVQLHHKRVGLDSFQAVIDKVKERLARWTPKTFSLAGRATLVSSVSSAIPAYTMQTSHLPSTVCEALDKQNRSFLWGSTAESRKVPLVAWDEVCMEKRKGGLGLRHAKYQNQAFLMKLGWRLVTHREDLWVKVVRDKYKCGDDLIPRIEAKRPGSNVWTGIKRTWDKVRGGIESTTNPPGVRWKWERHGEFTVKSAYSVVSNKGREHGYNWESIWKVRAPHRCKMLLWLLARKCLLTNANRMRRGLTNDQSCALCGAWCEDIIHVFRDCTHSRSLWRKVVPPDKWRTFCNKPLSEWIWWNISGRSNANKEWASRFTILCWWIWKRRNLFVFEKQFTPNSNIIASTNAMLESRNSMNNRLAGMPLNGITLTTSRGFWHPPEAGWVKVNVDGAYSRTTNKGACGGIIRSSSGSFLRGFFHSIERGDELTAEAWACLLGLKTAWAMGFRKVWLESDSMECITLLSHAQGGSHRDSDILDEVKQLLQMEWETKVLHVPRSGNKAADFLALKGLESGWGFHEVYQPSEALEVILRQDCNGCNTLVGGS